MHRIDHAPHRLRVWRRFRRLSQEDLSARAAVSLSTINRLERGTTRPRPAVARRLARALSAAPDCVAELAGTIPCLPRERAYLAARDKDAVCGADEA
jgi:transcriptional regulator with XRE-family HTH domain